MSNGVPPWRHSAVASQITAAPTHQFHPIAVAYRLPLDATPGRVVLSLANYLPPGRAEEKIEVSGREVVSMAATEADGIGFSFDEFDCPNGSGGGGVGGLADGLVVVSGG